MARADTSNGSKRRRLWAQVRREEDVCRVPVCVAPSRLIDKSLRWPHPLSFTVDHIESATKRPELALVRSNLRAAHKVCNQKRGVAREEPSIAW